MYESWAPGLSGIIVKLGHISCKLTINIIIFIIKILKCLCFLHFSQSQTYSKWMKTFTCSFSFLSLIVPFSYPHIPKRLSKFERQNAKHWKWSSIDMSAARPLPRFYNPQRTIPGSISLRNWDSGKEDTDLISRLLSFSDGSEMTFTECVIWYEAQYGFVIMVIWMTNGTDLETP